MQKPLLLAVDDEPDILTALGDLLDDRFRLIVTTSPEEALAIAGREPDIAVIISDQRMPGLTGDEFLARARTLTDAEAILLTGYADLGAVVGALNRGGIVGYVTKPWDPDTLRSMVIGAHARWQLARDLAVERDLLQGLLDHAGGAISFKDREGRFVRLNQEKAGILGYDRDQLVGRAETDFLGPARAAELARADAVAVTARGRTEQVEERRAGAGARWFQVQRIPIIDAAGEVAHLATIERDISDQRVMEARLRQADKIKALGTLAGGIAHDFNNLLTAILGSLNLALRKLPPDERLKRLLENALTAANRGTSLTQRLLTFSRRQDLAPRIVDANAVITGMSDLVLRTIGALNRVEHDLAPELWTTVVDPEQLELALLNLCINARDAMPDGGVITVTTRNRHLRDGEVAEVAAGDYIAIAVADNGCGIPPDVMEHVFEPFFTTKDVGQGTGLGLAMVHGLAQQSGGGAAITSEPGKGTLVELFFPRSIGVVQVEEKAPEAGAAAASPRRILLVDDDPEVREVVAELLLDMGHDLIETASGAAALSALAQDDQVDLVIADLAMPGMTGFEFATAVRERWSHLPILMVTGYADITKLPSLPGEFALLHKPFEQAELRLRIAELTRKP
ncbi:MAG: response regulator [Alphaproteobacteria bacterium]|nr:response regulator [Alphaproteobacteria bacterium]